MKRPLGALTKDQRTQIQQSLKEGHPRKLWWTWKGTSRFRNMYNSIFYSHEAHLLDVNNVWWFSNYFHAWAYALRSRSDQDKRIT